MKYCLHYSPNLKIFKDIDEIKFQEENFNKVIDTFLVYPQKTLILEITADIMSAENWMELEKIFRQAPHRIVFCVSTKEQAHICKDLGIKFYCGFKITSYQELRWWYEFGACSFVLGSPLFFELDSIKKEFPDISIRSCANVAHTSNFQYSDGGITGTYIRPEGVEAYSYYIDVLEFFAIENKISEYELYEIYSQKRLWIGELKDIIINLNAAGESGLIYDDFDMTRVNCRQICQARKNSCHYCKTCFGIANYQFFTKLQNSLKEENDDYKERYEQAYLRYLHKQESLKENNEE